jgi:23S rRNA (cytidine2498-2'-O)-methyltransferase
MKTIEELVAAVRELPAPRRLHVFERDRWKPGDEPDDFIAGADASRVREAILEQAGDLFLDGGRVDVAREGELVVDVIVPPDPDPLWLGAHLHRADRTPWPGGRIPVDVPADAPSRAYRKIEEAIVWSRAPLAAGQTAVEIGAAPGGASLALVRRGLLVVGVDPGEMDPAVASAAADRGVRFTHLQVTGGALRIEQLPDRVDWVVLDVNLAPQVALHMARRIVQALRPAPRGVLFTLKMNEWRFAAELPELLRRVEEMGLRDVRATQLPSNRQEIFVYAIHPGAARR